MLTSKVQTSRFMGKGIPSQNYILLTREQGKDIPPKKNCIPEKVDVCSEPKSIKKKVPKSTVLARNRV